MKPIDATQPARWILLFLPYVVFAAVTSAANSLAGLLAGLALTLEQALADVAATGQPLPSPFLLCMAAMFALHLVIDGQGGPAWTPSSLRLRVDCSMALILVGTLVIGQPFARNLLRRLPATGQPSPAPPDCAHGAVALTLLWAGVFGLLAALEWAIRSRGLPDASAAPLVLLVLMGAAYQSANVCRRASSLDRSTS